MRHSLIFLTILMWIVIIAGFATPAIDPDSIPDYALSKSLVRDQDFTLGNDPVFWDREDLKLDPRGDRTRRTVSRSPGMAYGYYPFMKWIPQNSLAQIFIQNLSHFRSETVRTDAFAILIGTLIWGLILLFICYRLLYERYSTGISHWAVFLVFVGTPLYFFTLASPGRSFILEACCLAFSLKFMDRARSDEVFNPEGYVFLSGLTAGFLILTNGILVPAVCVLWISSLFIRRYMDSLRFGVLFVRLIIFLLGLSPSLIILGLHNDRYFGGWFHGSFMPQIVFPPDFSALTYLIFPSKGLFLWFPLIAVSVLGLILMIRRDAWMGITGLCLMGSAILSTLLAPGTMIDSTFGLSGLVALSAVIVVGSAEILSLRRVPATALLIVLALFSFFNSLMFTALIHGPSNTRTSLPMYNIWSETWAAMKTRNIFSPTGLIDDALKEGDVPAVIPNLTRYITRPDTIMILGVNGSFNPTDPDILQGYMKVRSGAENPATLTFSLWPFLDKDKKYRPDSKSAEFNISVPIPKGINSIGWIFNHQGSLQLEIPGYQGRISASRILLKNTGRKFLLQAHIAMSVTAGESVRTMVFDIERPR